MATLEPQPRESFAHVANCMLRGVLQAPPNQVKPAQMKQALRRTIAALQRDVISDDPALYRALPERLRAARVADKALSRQRPTLCHRALRQFWSI